MYNSPACILHKREKVDEDESQDLCLLVVLVTQISGFNLGLRQLLFYMIHKLF